MIVVEEETPAHIAAIRDVTVGHILFSRVFIHDNRGPMPAVALAPVAVVPERQRRGIGSMLVRAGLQECRVRAERIVLVVGHPDYYPRFGFSHPLTRNLRSPYEGNAFMALELVAGALEGVNGRVRYPAAFEALS
jgi:putative acetyltransferase